MDPTHPSHPRPRQGQARSRVPPSRSGQAYWLSPRGRLGICQTRPSPYSRRVGRHHRRHEPRLTLWPPGHPPDTPKGRQVGGRPSIRSPPQLPSRSVLPCGTSPDGPRHLHGRTPPLQVPARRSLPVPSRRLGSPALPLYLSHVLPPLSSIHS